MDRKTKRSTPKAVVEKRSPRTRSITFTVHAPIKGRSEGDRPPKTFVAAFDDNDLLLGAAPVERGAAKLTLPASVVGQAVQLFHAPVEEEVMNPTVGRLRRRLAVEERLLIGPRLKLKLPPAFLERWKVSCCRVRGRVVVKVTLPNGTVQERPLCNARVVICEVDRSIYDLIRRLPNDLIFRIRDEFVTAMPQPVPPIPPVTRLFEVAPQTLPTEAAHDALDHVQQHGPAMPAGPAVSKAVARESLQTLVGATAVDLLRDALIARVDLLKPIWCLFDWLTPFYRTDCLRTVEIDENGNFDTHIEYPCFGDRPDLYFKVEQDCHPGWLTVHAPPVQCNTYWDYCCGTPVKIVVTHPAASPGRAPSCVWPYVAGDPASVGSWNLLPYDSGVFVVHGALLPSGKVLMYSGTAEANLPRESRVWDPTTGALATQSFADDLFCSGHAMLADGRVLVNGGAIPGQGRGIKATYIFDPVGETWTKVKDMNHARWYPTSLTLPNGRVITFSGRDENGAVVPQVEIYNPGTNTWTDLPASANKTLDIYPSLHLMPDGTILYTGTRWDGSSAAWISPPATARLNLGTNSWTDVDDHEVPDRTEGGSVLLPPFEPGPFIHEHADIPKPRKMEPTVTRVLVMGGRGATATAEIIDMGDAAPVWRRTADMHIPRRNVNAVLLPDGKVLACSGIRHFKWDGDPGYAYEAELFDPQMETWTLMAPMTVGRQYHSVSLLLADGRVLNVGSQGASVREMRMEIYSPPYLFRGPRPKITSLPATAGYGEAFIIESPDVCRIDRVVFVRPSSITHHTNTDQRYLPLKWQRDGHCGLRITTPADSLIAPPGYYLLFILDDCGVPSIGRFVKIG